MSNIQIPNLPSAAALNGTEQYEGVQAGSSVQISTAQLAAYINANYPPPGVSSISTSGPITGGTITSSGTIGLAGASVSNFYLAGMAARTLKGNSTGGPATPSDMSISTALDMVGSTRGALLYRGSSGWSILPPGAPESFLMSNGSGADPTWEDVMPVTLDLLNAPVDISSIGNNTVIAAVPGKSIYVHQITLALASKTTVTFKSGNTAITGPMSITALLESVQATRYFKTAVGEALVIALGDAIQTGGFLSYSLQDS